MKIGLIVLCVWFLFFVVIFYGILYSIWKHTANETVFFKLVLCAKKSLAKNTGISLKIYRNRKFSIQNTYNLNKNEMWFGYGNGFMGKFSLFYLHNANTHMCFVKITL